MIRLNVDGTFVFNKLSFKPYVKLFRIPDEVEEEGEEEGVDAEGENPEEGEGQDGQEAEEENADEN